MTRAASGNPGAPLGFPGRADVAAPPGAGFGPVRPPAGRSGPAPL